jgi:lipoyl(octanoyl) transferase
VSERRTRWTWLGRIGYGEAVKLQLALRERLKRGEGEEHLLLLEHPHVYTLGRNASGGDVVASRAWLSARGVEVHETDRGGQVTYHGPGQIVGYPILDLDPDRRDVRRYVADLSAALVATLASYGIEARAAERSAQTGVWVEERKIASIGIHLSRWITTHGFALNATTDLSFFTGIVPCGMPDVRLTSIAAEGSGEPPVEEVAARFLAPFAERFGRVLAEAAPGEVLAACRTAS